MSRRSRAGGSKQNRSQHHPPDPIMLVSVVRQRTLPRAERVDFRVLPLQRLSAPNRRYHTDISTVVEGLKRKPAYRRQQVKSRIGCRKPDEEGHATGNTFGSSRDLFFDLSALPSMERGCVSAAVSSMADDMIPDRRR